MNNHSLTQLGLQSMSYKNPELQMAEENPIEVNLVNSSENSIVFVGTGLADIWQIEDSAEWQLLENILQTFQIDSTNASCFDSNLIQTDEAIQLTIDEIIEQGTETVYSFDEEGRLIEELQEGLVVVFLPTLSEQINDWQAKKTCYTTFVDV